MTISELWDQYIGDDKSLYTFKEIAPPKPTASQGDECRALCQQNVCKSLGTNWGCPPGTGTIGECLGALKMFRKTAVIYRRFNVNHKDRDCLAVISREHQTMLRGFSDLLRKGGYKTLPLSDGGCSYCERCPYPLPCTHPDERVPSVSAYGILMMPYMEDNGIPFKFEDNAVTLYALLLYNDPPADRSAR